MRTLKPVVLSRFTSSSTRDGCATSTEGWLGSSCGYSPSSGVRWYGGHRGQWQRPTGSCWRSPYVWCTTCSAVERWDQVRNRHHLPNPHQAVLAHLPLETCTYQSNLHTASVTRPAVICGFIKSYSNFLGLTVNKNSFNLELHSDVCVATPLRWQKCFCSQVVNLIRKLI